MDVSGDLASGRRYWVTFADDSRILVEAWADKHGDIDISNDLTNFGMWVGSKGAPVNRENIASIEEVE